MISTANRDPARKRTEYYPWWLDNLADDVTGAGAAIGLIVLCFVGGALTPANALKAKEFIREFSWALDAYVGVMVFFGWLIWRYNRRIFPVKHRNWDHSFLCRRCDNRVLIAR